MTGYLIVGGVAIVTTLGGAYAAMTMSAAHHAAPRTEATLALELMKIEPVSVPVVRFGKIVGYVIARVTISAPSSELKTLRPVVMAFATEAVFRAVYEEPTFDFAGLKVVELKTSADRISRFANERLGRPIVQASIIDGMSFVEPSGIRAHKGR